MKFRDISLRTTPSADMKFRDISLRTTPSADMKFYTTGTEPLENMADRYDRE
jgi:hypothetical protein